MGMSKDEFRKELLARQRRAKIKKAKAYEREFEEYMYMLDMRIKDYKYKKFVR